MLTKAVCVLALALFAQAQYWNCPLNEVYYDSTNCTSTPKCNDDSCSPITNCTYDECLSAACFCAKGYSRDCKGNCIPSEYCPCVQQICKSIACPKFEKYSNCPQRLCDACPGPVLRQCDQTQVCRGGCTCISGYKRLNGTCVPESQCPPLKG